MKRIFTVLLALTLICSLAACGSNETDTPVSSEPKSETAQVSDSNTLVDQAAEEQDNGARPAIKDTIENFDQYDTIFVGYPTWWSDMPMILYTFFDTYDFSSKNNIPFNTHDGSGFSNTISTISVYLLSLKCKEG